VIPSAKSREALRPNAKIAVKLVVSRTHCSQAKPSSVPEIELLRKRVSVRWNPTLNQMVDVRRGKELLYPCWLVWISPEVFAGAYSLGPPVPLSLCSCAMAPMVKATKPIATAAATFVSIDSVICFSYPLKYISQPAGLSGFQITVFSENANKGGPESPGKASAPPCPITE